MAKNMSQLEPLISSCPACMQNFKLLFCQITCAGNQGSFIEVLNTSVSKERDDSNGTLVKNVVDNVNYYMKSHFADGFYKSCKDIGFQMSNMNLWQFAYGFFLMNKALDLLSVLGKAEKYGGRSPYQISFKIMDEPAAGDFNPVDASVKSCSDPGYFCPCVDCHETCADPEPWPLKYNSCHLTESIKCIAFGSVAAFLVFCFVIFLWRNFMSSLILGTSSSRNRKRRSTAASRKLPESPVVAVANEESEAGPSTPMLVRRLEGKGDEEMMMQHEEEVYELSHCQTEYIVNSFLHRIFYHLGQIVGRYPIVVILLCGLVVGIAGASFAWNPVTIETNPERLWVSPNSKALAERRYFDETFGPFWRVQQVMLSPPSKIVAQGNGGDKSIITRENLQR